MKVKKYQTGGQLLDLGVGLGALAYGASSLEGANAAFDRATAAAPSLETPEQYYENYRNAYDASLARMENEQIQRNLATGVQALQQAGGRAVVGGLGVAVAQSQNAQRQMLATERAARATAGQQLAMAEERSVLRRERRAEVEKQRAMQAANTARDLMIQGATAVATSGSSLIPQVAGKLKDWVGAERSGDISQRPQWMLSAQEYLSGLRHRPEAQNMDEYLREFTPTLPMPDTQADLSQAATEAFKRPAVNIVQPVTETMKMAQEGIKKELQERPLAPADATYVAPPAHLRYMQNTFGVQDATSGFSNFQFDPNSGGWIPKEGAGSMDIQYAPQLPNAWDYKRGLPKPRVKDAEYWNRFFSESDYYSQGGMTKGAFSHKSNPIDLVQNGQKVGEATGNEVILNPEQAAAIAKESSYARRLFKKFAKQAKKK